MMTFLQNPPPITINGQFTTSVYQMTLQSVSLNDIYEWTPKVTQKIQTLPGFVDVSSDLLIASPQVRVDIDRDRAILQTLTSIRRAGATVVTMPRFDLEQFLQIHQDHGVTRSFVAPPIVVGLPCLMVSGILRSIEGLAGQAAGNNPDQIWITVRGLVNWTCNVFLPVYAVLQLVQGVLVYGGVGHRVYYGGVWMRHFVVAALCLMLSGLLRLAEWFIAQGLGGVS